MGPIDMSLAATTRVVNTESQAGFVSTSLPVLFHILVWGYALVVILCSFPEPVGKYDDAIQLVDGMLVQQGYIPNVDFYSGYPPLHPYINAALFHLLGRTVVAARIMAGVLYIFVLLLATRFFRLYFSSSRVFAPAAVLLLAAAIGSAIKTPWWPGLALSLAALLTYLCSQSLNRNRLWAVGSSGLLTGFALLFRWNFGGYVAIVVAIDLLLAWWLNGDARWERPRLNTELKTMATFAVPLVAFSLAFCFWVYGHNITALPGFIMTAQKSMALRFIRLPFAADIACAAVLPPAWFFFRVLQGSDEFTNRAGIAAALSGSILAITFAGRTHSQIAIIVLALELAAVIFLHVHVRRLERSEFNALVFFCCLLHYLLSRSDWEHWRPIAIAYALLLPLLVIPRHNPAETGFKPAAAKGTALAILTAAIFLFMVAADFRPQPGSLPYAISLLRHLVRHPHMMDADLTAVGASLPAEWDFIYPDRDEWQAIRYLRSRSSPSSPIFVGVQDHSRVFLNDMRMYWLANRPIGVRTLQLEGRMVFEAPVQLEMIADLSRNKVAWVILDCVADPGDETFAKSAYRGSTLLDDYIRSHFIEEARFGRYAILTRVMN